MSAINDIAAERQRQISAEGWTTDHDDNHLVGELQMAAACYAMAGVKTNTVIARLWPWERKWWKPKDRRRNLVKAGALIVAGIEKIDRAAAGEKDNG